MHNQFVRLGVVLTLICGLAAGALALVNSFTEPRIKAAKEASLQQSLAKALSGAAKFEEDKAFLETAQREDSSLAVARSFYRAQSSDGSPAGIVATVAPRGYGGEIETMVGIGADGQLQAVLVLSQTETPGLGTKTAESDFLQEFRGARSGDRLAVNKDGGRIAAVAGATISSRAVTLGVNVALSLAKRAGF